MPTDEPKKYQIEFTSSALDDLSSLPKKIQKQVVEAAEKLTETARPSGSKQLAGYKKLYRLRTGQYRIVYTIENGVLVVIIVAVGSRKDIYELVKRRIK